MISYLSPFAISTLVLAASLAPSTINAATPSPGCSGPTPTPAPGQWDANKSFEGRNYSHKYSYPASSVAGPNDPSPLLLYFHGWGGSSGSCGSTCADANDRGYATISLTGIGSEDGHKNSWNGFGSTSSGMGVADSDALTAGDTYCNNPEENDRTCNVRSYNIDCYTGCGSCTDKCWWTTCKDSVQQTLEVLEDFLDNYCIDLDRINAAGCSNGGMFLYELANDERTARYLAGISPQVGLPHYGYNKGPNPNYKIHHIGFWGEKDGTVPPKENPSTARCSVPCRTSERNGWFYTSSDCTMDKWASDLGLVADATVLDDYDIPAYAELTECSAYTSSQDDDAVVVGCIFDGGHTCNDGYMNSVALNFFDAHPKMYGNPTTSSSTATSTTTSVTTQATSTTTTAGGCSAFKSRSCRAESNCQWSQGKCVDKN